MEPCAILPLTHRAAFAAATAPVAGEAPLVRVVRAVGHAVPEDRIVVATLPTLAAGTVACLRGAELATAVAIAPASAARREVLRAGLDYLGAQPDTQTPVLVCDHRYPLSPTVVADRVLKAMGGGRDVVVPTLAVTDTFKTVDELGAVLTTVDRSRLQTVQYPRSFTASVLWQLISVSTPPTANDLDEFDAALAAGLDIGTVAGDTNGFHVELPRDAHLLAAVIAGRPN